MSFKAAEQEDEETLLFSAALDKVHQLHLKQVADLKASLAQHIEANLKQKEQLTLMKKLVSSAKLKIKEQANHISELEQLLGNLHRYNSSNGQTVCVEQSHQLSESEIVYESPAQQKFGVKEKFEQATAHPGDYGLDKTCPPLFESPTVPVTSAPPIREGHPCITDTHTHKTAIAGEVRVSEKSLQEGVPEETESLKDMTNHEDIWTVMSESSDTTSDESMNAILNDDNQEVIYICEDRQNGRQPIRSSSYREDGVSLDVTSLDEHLRNGEDELTALGSETCDSMFENNTRTSSKTLRLRKNMTAKKIKYKETDKSANDSLPTSSSTASSDHNSQLVEMPACTLDERELLSQDSAQDLDSPPFLCATISPFRSQPPHCSSPQTGCDCHDGMSMSMFPSTPVLPGDTKGQSLLTREHSTSIPPSDSQLSLNISQSLPPSPEVCAGMIPFNFTRGTDCHLSESLDKDLQTDSPQEKLDPKQIESRQFKQLTIPLQEKGIDCHNGCTKSSVDLILRTPSTSHTTILPTTPGISTVDSILSRPMKWGVVNQPTPILVSNYQKETNIQLNDPVKPCKRKGTKRHILDMQDTTTENEEIIPAKRKQNPGHSKPGAALQNTGDQLHACDARSEEMRHQISSPVVQSRALLKEKSTCGETLVREFSRPVGTIHGDKQQEDDQETTAKRMARKAGLPDYKCVTKILSKTDRDKLDGKACPECQAWYESSDRIHGDQRGHLKHTCRHKNLYQPPDSNPDLWNIGFPDSDECDDNIMNYV